MYVTIVLAALLALSTPNETELTAIPNTFVRAEKESGITWTDYGKALSTAESNGKKILVDVYTDWCHWCKKMDKNVYATKKVQEYLKKHFVSVKLNAESKSSHNVKGKNMTEKEIARAYGVRSFPTTMFLDASGDPITSVPGYIEADKFVLVLQYINEEHYKTTKWDEFVSEQQ